MARARPLFGEIDAVSATLCASDPLFAFVGAAWGLLPFFALVLRCGIAGYEYIALIVTIVSATMLALLAAFIGLVSDVFVRLPKNGYGPCSAPNKWNRKIFGALPLTDWCTNLLKLAEYPLDKPVTLAQLSE